MLSGFDLYPRWVPLPSLERVRRSYFSSRAYTFKISRYAPGTYMTEKTKIIFCDVKRCN